MSSIKYTLGHGVKKEWLVADVTGAILGGILAGRVFGQSRSFLAVGEPLGGIGTPS